MTDHSSASNSTELANYRIRSIGRSVAILAALAGIGIAAALINCQFVNDGAHRFMSAYLVSFAFILSVSLGSLFFVLIQHLMRAGWSVVVRRLAEFSCLNVIVVGLLFLPIAWSVWRGDGLVYSWSQTVAVAAAADSRFEQTNSPEMQLVSSSLSREAESSESPATGAPSQEQSGSHAAAKPYLNNTRFLITWAVLFAIWIGLAVFYYRHSVAQDTTKDVELTRKMEWWSGIATILFGFSLTFAAFDLLMTLDASWYSTIFGVYYFAGCAVAGLATLLLAVLMLKRLGLAPALFSDEVQRDLGRLLFAFVFFWAYIAFSQYLLLWYANMPETTNWLVRRGMSTATGYTNSWGWLVIFLLLSHFVIPFGGFMSRHVKSNSNAMIFWTIWLLVVHYFDLYWIVIPENNGGWTVSLIEIGTALAVISVYGISAVWIASRSCLFAVGDWLRTDGNIRFNDSSCCDGRSS